MPGTHWNARNQRKATQVHLINNPPRLATGGAHYLPECRVKFEGFENMVNELISLKAQQAKAEER